MLGKLAGAAWLNCWLAHFLWADTSPAATQTRPRRQRFRVVKQAARYSARDNKHMVPVSALLKIAKDWVRVAGDLAGCADCDGYG